MELSDREMNRESQPLPDEFLAMLRQLEESYLVEEDPIRQSGFGGGKARWRKEREIILDPICSNGDFLDVGCANGYLLQCLMRWAGEKNITITPYGVDQGAGLIKLARIRLPEYASHFWIANAWNWKPLRKFRYVYSLYDCVPQDFFAEYVRKLLDGYVQNNGTLIIGAYGSPSGNKPARDISYDLNSSAFTVAGNASIGNLPVTRIAWINNKAASNK